jgi:DNA-binding response OmpR family regulator
MAGQAHKILIIDDEAFIRRLIEQTLEDLEERGVEILSADNGRDGLEMIRAQKPNLVFLDVMMPGLDGFEVCRAARQDADTTNPFIVLLTAKGQDDDKRIGEEAGANRYLTKPFDPDELFALAEEVIEHRPN